MPVSAAAVGARTTPIVHEVDNRWLMAYAAALGETSPRYFDTTQPGGIAAHPLFPVCVEWPTMLALRDLAALTDTLRDDEARRGVHATHDLSIERPIAAGDRLTTTAEVTGIERRKPGAYLTCVLTTVDASGEVVCRTTQGSLYLGVDVDGPDRPAPGPSTSGLSTSGPSTSRPGAPPSTDASGAGAVVACERIDIGAGDAHTYTECARIWNPIHTDVAVARAAGLAEIILHGTATLAHAVTVGVAALGGGDPATVRRISGRFGAMVALPSVLTVEVRRDGSFTVHTPDGNPAVSHGRLTFA